MALAGGVPVYYPNLQVQFTLFVAILPSLNLGFVVCEECSHASVGLAQAYPNYIYLHTVLTVIMAGLLSMFSNLPLLATKTVKKQT